jgi:NADH dehydrogenase FAD-containing subunit
VSDDLVAANRRLRDENLRLREDLQHARERLRYALGDVAALRKRIPSTATQAAAPGSGATRESDPLERLFEAIRPTRSQRR